MSALPAQIPEFPHEPVAVRPVPGAAVQLRAERRADLAQAESADDKLGQDTVVLAMTELFGVVDAFVITSASNGRHVRTLVEEVERSVKEAHHLAPVRVEGLGDATWVLMDYGDFIVHVFLQETRDYYDLEHLWSGAPGTVARRSQRRRLGVDYVVAVVAVAGMTCQR
jgi:ribosome-associated protein